MFRIFHTILYLIFVVSKTTAEISYKVTASTKNETGCYAKTNYTTKAHDFKRPVFKKKLFPVRYLLQLESTGNWAFSEDRFGNNVIVEQRLSSYAVSPDTQAGTWAIKGNGLRDIPSFKVTAASEDCKETNPSTKGHGKSKFSRGLPTGTNESKDAATSNESKDDISKYVYMGCGAAGAVALISCFLSACFCIRRQRKKSKRESVDENPDYGEAYYKGNSQIVDQNDYYFTDV